MAKKSVKKQVKKATPKASKAPAGMMALKDMMMAKAMKTKGKKGMMK